MKRNFLEYHKGFNSCPACQRPEPHPFCHHPEKADVIVNDRSDRWWGSWFPKWRGVEGWIAYTQFICGYCRCRWKTQYAWNAEQPSPEDTEKMQFYYNAGYLKPAEQLMANNLYKELQINGGSIAQHQEVIRKLRGEQQEEKPPLLNRPNQRRIRLEG